MRFLFGGGITHTVVELAKKLSGLNIPQIEVANHINHCKHPLDNYSAC